MAHRTLLAQANSNRWVKIKITKPTVAWRSEDGDGFHSVSTARLPAGLTKSEIASIRKSIRDDYSTRCQHSYDCCGRWYVSFDAQVVGRRLTLKMFNYCNV